MKAERMFVMVERLLGSRGCSACTVHSLLTQFTNSHFDCDVPGSLLTQLVINSAQVKKRFGAQDSTRSHSNFVAEVSARRRGGFVAEVSARRFRRGGFGTEVSARRFRRGGFD